MSSKYCFVYILTNRKNGVLYIGLTNNLKRRIYEHKKGMVEGFTKKYHLKSLVYYEVFEDINQAILREKRIKKWKRDWKIKLIESKNPQWQDLYLKI